MALDAKVRVQGVQCDLTVAVASVTMCAGPSEDIKARDLRMSANAMGTRVA